MSSDTSKKSRMGLFVGVFAVVIAAVAYVGVKFPVPEENTSGTIMPAERYRGDQLSSDDVVLGDESISVLMQSDLYVQITTDGDFANAMRSDAFQNALASDAFRNALESDSFRNALQSDAFRNALQSTAFRNALQNNAFRNELQNSAFRNALQNDALRNAIQ